jgi:hypothetical protein
MIKENDNYKVVFYFLSPNVLLLFILKIASNEGIKQFHLSLNY